MKSPISKANLKLDVKDKYKVILVRIVSGVLHVIKTQNIKIYTKEVAYRSARFTFDIAKPIYRKKNTYFYMVDIKEGQVTVKNYKLIKGRVPPEMIESILYESIVQQTVAGLEKMKLGPIIVYVLLAAGMALACGYILGINFPTGA